LKRLLLVGLLTIGLILVVAFTVGYFHSTTTILDRPSNLTGKTETIVVYYINWACDCPDFIESGYYDCQPHYEPKEEDCIFIEPSNSDLKVPMSFYEKEYFTKKLRLTGQFYQDKGIPKTYEQKTPEKPNKAKVFRYDEIEIIDKDK
jgi:hypothetical protein